MKVEMQIHTRSAMFTCEMPRVLEEITTEKALGMNNAKHYRKSFDEALGFDEHLFDQHVDSVIIPLTSIEYIIQRIVK